MIFDSFTFVQSATILVCSFAAIYTSAASKLFAQESFTVADCYREFPSFAIALITYAIINRNLKSQWF